ncbi:hypothetical protein LWI29_004704 [Acer saccharum]|uniref:SAWADEE domain-containing protein n=1 Tax=Acer saccharum TaxID=4024 RepID=A0AA39SCC7_ACESA|nr:hypothetical protein LWI29_004704 [Acer saccharum]
MLTSVNSPSSLLQVVSNGDDEDDDELEFRSYVDDAWYSVRVAFDGRAGGKLIVRYCNFPDDNDSVYEAGKFFTFDELDNFACRFRPVSVQLQDSECRDVVADGLLVCASHAFTDNEVLFYDAIVEQATKCVKRSASDISPCEEVGKSSNLLKRNREDADFGGVGNYYTILLENVEKELSPSTIIEFIHRQTSITAQAYVLPSLSSECYTRSVIVPCVVAKNFSRHDIFRASSIGTPMFASQRKLQYVNCGKGDELKVVWSRTEEYKTAKELRDLLVEFTDHQERLQKSLAFEERKIMKSSPELAPIGQGYGLTETCAGAAFSEWDDTTAGPVGPPLPCSYIKLVSWEEGGYKSSDKPIPRGEVVVGGFSVTAGYFNNPEKTDEVYKVHFLSMLMKGVGDIGQFHPDGCPEIIDRKKVIVKLQHGEYISLGKVEAALSSSNYVDSIMVHADPFHNYCVTQEPWTPESGLVTAALKIKREQLKAKFKDDLQKMYG